MSVYCGPKREFSDIPPFENGDEKMKRSFLRLLQSLSDSVTPSSVPVPELRKKGKNKKTGPNRSRRLGLEPLEERAMLSAASIAFEAPRTFNYTPSTGSNIVFGLESTAFLSFGKMHTGADSFGDIISINQNQDTVSVFLHNKSASNPQYGTAVNTKLSGLSGQSQYREYAIADMNGDGISDLIVLGQVSQANGVCCLTANIFLGKNDGTFNTSSSEIVFPSLLPAGSAGSDIAILSYQVRDITGDSYPELIVSLKGTTIPAKEVKVESYYYSGKSGGFDTTAHVLSNTTGTLIGFGNVTGTSGSLQLITGTETEQSSLDQQTLNFYNFNLANDTAVAAGKSKALNGAPYWTLIANANSDSADEIVSGISYINNLSQQKYGVRIAHVSSLSSGTAEVVFSPSTPTVYDVDIAPIFGTIGDVNGDGKPDIIISDGTAYQILIGNGSTFTAQPKVETYANYIATTVGDFNGDGYQDVIAVGQGHVMFLPGNPSHPNYNTGKKLFDLPVKADYVAFGDFNGDGILDIAFCSGMAGTTIYVYAGIKHTGQAGSEVLFQFDSSYIDASLVTGLVAGNFATKAASGSTKVDLAVLNAGTSVVIITVGQDQGKDHRPTTSLGTTAVHIAKGDFNKDGYDDIVLANETAGTITIGWNDGTGRFGNTITKRVGDADTGGNTGSHPSVVAVADLDGDSKLDIAVLNTRTHRVEFLFQNSTGTDFVSNPSGAQSYLELPFEMETGAQYSMILDDFDLDGRIDVIVGLSSSNNQIAVFQNKGSKAGEFNATPSWLTVPANSLKGSVNGKISWGMATKYLPGTVSTTGTPGVVVVSGNTIYRIKNTTEPESMLGTFQMILRDPANSPTTPDSNQYTNLNGLTKLDWLNEWGTYYLEIWGTSASATEGISSFRCGVNFDTTLFKVQTSDIQSIAAYTMSTPVVSTSGTVGTITIEGTTNSTRGNNQYTLLARIKLTPALSTTNSPPEKENVGVSIPATGYAVSVNSALHFVSGTVQINGKGVMTTIGAETLPVYPVVFDVNDDGIINFADFTLFAAAFGKTFTSTSAEAKFDFNYDAKINFADFTAFARTFGYSRGTGISNSLLPNMSNWVASTLVASVLNLDIESSGKSAPVQETEQTLLAFDFGGVESEEVVAMSLVLTDILLDSGTISHLEEAESSVATAASNAVPTNEPLVSNAVFSDRPLTRLATLQTLGLADRPLQSAAAIRSFNVDLALSRYASDDDLKRSEDSTDWYVEENRSVSVLDKVLVDLFD